MSTGTWASVTETNCTCPYLEDNAANPDLPIRFDPDLNEYQIVWPIGDGYGSMLLYHCPFCGGRTPKSLRETLFATVPNEEYERLHVLTRGIKSIEDAIRILGTPSRDEATTVPPDFTPPTERDGRSNWPVRFLTFSDCSDVAEVQVSVKADNTVEVSCGPKYTGPRKRAV
jgi:hypothetical protein